MVLFVISEAKDFKLCKLAVLCRCYAKEIEIGWGRG